MEIVSPEDNPDEVKSLVQSGFAFPSVEPCLHTALSPGACVVATLKDEGEIELQKMQYTNGEITAVTENDCSSSHFFCHRGQ